MEKVSYRADIDGIRAIAVISVLFFHLDFKYFSGGFIGVDIFFVISGYLITNLIKKELENSGKFSFKNFYIRRIRRLFPALIVILVVTMIFASLILSPTHLSRFGGALTSSLLSSSNFFFWLESDYFDVSSKLKPLLHTWSLSVEEQFYLLWPITLIFLINLKSKWKMIGIMVFLGLFSLYMNEIFSDGSVSLINNYLTLLKEYIKDGRSTIFFLLPFRIYEFMIGAVLVWIIPYKVKIKYFYDILFFVGIFFIGYSILCFNNKMLFPSYYALLPTIGTGLLIYTGSKTKFNIILVNRFSVWIGLISYSLYLVHWPIIVFVNYLSTNTNIFVSIVIVFVSILLASLSYKYIEQPFRKKELKLGDPTWKYSSIFTVLLTAYLGINMYSNNGWEWRVKSIINFENTGDSKDFHKKFYGGAGYTYSGGVNTRKPADIVMLGDSHARHYIEGLYKVLAKPEQLNLYNNSGLSCIMLPSFTRVRKGINYDKLCPAALSKGLSFLDKGNKNAILIISESWVSQMKRASLLDSKGNRLDINITKEHVGKGLLELKKRIGDNTLVVIGQVPGTKYNLYDIFTRPRPILFFKKDDEKYLRSHSRNKFTDFNEYIKNISNETGKFIFLDPHDILCKNGLCQNLDEEKRLIYSDTSHLSKYGSIAVIKGFLPKLKEILRANK